MFIAIESQYAEYGKTPYGAMVRGVGFGIKSLTSKKWVMIWKRLSRNKALQKMSDCHFPEMEIREMGASYTYYRFTQISSNQTRPIFLYRPGHINRLIDIIIDCMDASRAFATQSLRVAKMKSIYADCFLPAYFC